MLFVQVAQTTAPIVVTSTQPLITSVLQWVSGLTLPGVLVTAWGVSRWYTKKEDTAKSTIADALAKVDQIRTNDLHHMQLTLTELKEGQKEFAEAADRHKNDMITAMNSNKDAIVNAIISSRK